MEAPSDPTDRHLTEREIKLVKNSWAALRDVPPALIGDVFYRKLFLDQPGLRRMFTSGPEEQAVKLVEMLSLIVARLERLDEISDEVAMLARRHVDYGVKEQHYADVGAALVWTLNQALRNEWTAELETAWAKCYGILANAMIGAAKS